MTPASPIDLLPLRAVFVVALAGILGMVEAGFQLGWLRRRRAAPELESPVGGIVGAELGLLALLLAFTFGIGASRFEGRREALLDEANALGTAYLRAGMLAAPEGPAVRTLLRDYVDVRLGGVRSGDLDLVLRRSSELHARLWSLAEAAAARAPGSIPTGLFVASLNDVIDLHAKRLAVLRSRIPPTIWLVLCAVTLCSSAAMGYQLGLAGSNRSPAVLSVAVTFAAVLWLLVDLDRPREGLLRVSQQPMIELRESMGADAAPR